jgi:hypothetical protein
MIDWILNTLNFLKMKMKLFLTGIALTALTTIAFSQQPDSVQGHRNCPGKATYVDANKNGKCDNNQNKFANADTISKNGTACAGVCRQHAGQGCGQRAGQGQGQCADKGRSRDKNFVDADKNGICDNYEAEIKK